jgi:hypothetical protein
MAALRHCRRHPHQHARVERLGDDVLAAKAQFGQPIGANHGVGHIFLGQRGQRVVAAIFISMLILRGAHIERAAEDEGEAEHVVDLVG